MKLMHRRQPRRQEHRHSFCSTHYPCVAIVAVVSCLIDVAQSFNIIPATTITALHIKSKDHEWLNPPALRPRSPYSLPRSSPLSYHAPRRKTEAMKGGEGNESRRCRTLVVVGGGAAGFFGAIQAAVSGDSKLQVIVLEAGRRPLQKVKISGGGRCNVMHDARKPVSLIAEGYPRGRKELVGPFKSLFGPSDAAEWFRARGVKLKTEGDGRMFPITNDSQTIIDCLEGAARDAGVHVITSAKVTSIVREQINDSTNGEIIKSEAIDANDESLHELRSPTIAATSLFELIFTTATPLSPSAREALLLTAATEQSGKLTYHVACDYVLQATGASREGHAWAGKLGHAVCAPVPSLFTLTIRDPRLQGLSGLSVQDAEVKLLPAQPEPSQTKENDGEVTIRKEAGRDQEQDGGAEAAAADDRTDTGRKAKKDKKQPTFSQRGPILITHTGVSGPAALKLSAFGARELSEGGYRGKLVVNWLAGNDPSKALEELQAYRVRNSKKTVYAFCPISGKGGPGTRERNRVHGRQDGARPPQAPTPVTPRRLWQSLAIACGIAEGDRWADMSKAKLSALARELTACELQVVGKGTFKEEFVTCGGVALSAVDMRTMESRTVPGLFFAGEVVDIDGVTGGYNFQSAWTTGWVAGSAIGVSARAATAVTRERRSFATDDGRRRGGSFPEQDGRRIYGSGAMAGAPAVVME